MKSKNTILIMIMLSTACIFSFTLIQQHKPWPVPESAKKMKNPLKNDSENLNLGKVLYAKHCKSCHGKNGEGDGTKAAELATFPGDFTGAEFQAQTDGAILYKTSEGREDMPSFKKKIPDQEELWQLVIYMRSLKAK
jgi:mono/diheme cytochrome c family protein